MSAIDKFKELIHPQASVLLEDDTNGKHRVELREKKASQSLMSISGIPDNSIVFNLDDYFQQPDQIFSGSKNEACRSDFIIISENGSDRQIVIIELKSGDANTSHIIKQLHGGRAFLSYCQGIFSEFWGYDLDLNQFNIHYVSCKRTTTKRKTSGHRSNPVSNTTPENMLRLTGSHLFRYNQLIGRLN